MIRKSIEGNRYGKWTVIKMHSLDNTKRNTKWLCRCDCGKEKAVSRVSLVNGNSQSCGCLRHPPIKLKIKNNIYIDKNGCWNWKGKTKKDGYVIIHYRGKYQPLHRVSYEIYKGKIPSNQYICHHCDNRKCCNPDHLFAGTLSDNMKDMMKKGRGKNQFKRKSDD